MIMKIKKELKWNKFKGRPKVKKVRRINLTTLLKIRTLKMQKGKPRHAFKSKPRRAP